MAEIRVMLADDTDIAREGVQRILEREPDIEVVGVGTTIHDTIQKVQDLHPDILVLDLMWNKDESAGTDAIRRLARETPETKVIAITVYPHLIEQAKNAGAMAALNKEIPKEQLVQEIRSVHRLSPPPSPSQTMRTPTSLPVAQLTKRELEVLALLANGMTDKEIAKTLNIVESTAKNHVSHILRKLEVPNRARAAVVGIELGLVSTEKK